MSVAGIRSTLTFEERAALKRLVDERQRQRLTARMCERCGEPFEKQLRAGLAKRFCSERCRKLYWNVAYRRRRWESDEGYREMKRERMRAYRARLKAETAASPVPSAATVSDERKVAA